MPYRPEWLSQGAEVLVAEAAENRRQGKAVDFDAIVVGSGYGGAVAAARLSALSENGRPLRVCVLERGREYVPGTFPHDFSNLPGHVRFGRYYRAGVSGQRDGLYDFRSGGDVSVLLGSGLGGGSLINAAVAEPPEPWVFSDAAWPQALRDDPQRDTYFAAARTMLGVRPAPSNIPKNSALKELAASQNLNVRQVDVALHTEGSPPNPHGVPQRPCIKCGDCVTGCNFWAKNTLAMNYLPAAKRNGAGLYTNASVARVEKAAPVDGRPVWKIVLRLTVEPHPPLAPRELEVFARHVVLAAGTFGSTEILTRSRAAGLRVSPMLGRRVSTNGDMISVLYGQRTRVNAAPKESTPFAARNVGPTITAMMENGKHGAQRVVVQELSIPGALRRVFEEIVASAAMAVRLGITDYSRHSAQASDPAAVDADKVECSQIFAAMGDDGALGRLRMPNAWTRAAGDGAYGSMHLRWPKAGGVPIYDRQDEMLEPTENALGGLYLRSPLWMPVRKLLSQMLSGSKPEGKLFSVHPLGGCPMGETSAQGVVDHMGRVFDPDGHVHEGLLVLDGSIVPRALGINPLLTITALAERAIALYAPTRRWLPHDVSPQALPPIPAIAEPLAREKISTAVRFAERMTGDLALVPGARKVYTELEVEFGEIGDIPGFLQRGGHHVPIAKATLALDHGTPAKVTGDVYWMEPARTGPLGRMARGIVTWLWTRALSDIFEKPDRPDRAAPFQLRRDWMGIFKLASNVGEVRYLRYAMVLAEPLTHAGRVVLATGTRVQGLKTLKYGIGGNPWRQLSELTVRVERTGPDSILPPRKLGVLEIDLRHMLNRFTAQLQVTRQADQPSALMDQASIALFLARVVLKIHFWSFRAPSYEPYNPQRQAQRLPGPLPGLNWTQERVSTETIGSPEPVDLTLTRYWLGERPIKTPVLLIHGFGSGGIQFAHPRLTHNLVRHLAWRGFEVCVADLRTSIASPESRREWTLDEVAIEDVTTLVQHIASHCERGQVDVVAHCIGSAMFCTAALARNLSPQLGRVVLLQVGPLITLSEGNDFRGRLAAAARRYLPMKHVDSSVNTRGSSKWSEVFFDRLLNTYPYSAGESRAHRLLFWKPDTHSANCNRAAAVFGRLFDHHNLEPRTLDLLADLLGHTNLRTFEQTVRYAFDKRLTDYQGMADYVTEANVRKNFTFPVRFIHGAVNDVFAPETTQRSLDLLKRVHGPEHPVERVVVEGYGHLDPLVGTRAHRDVYPRISEFLDAPAPAPRAPAVLAREHYVKAPLIGPVVGWTRKEGDRWVARVWCRLDDEHDYPASVIAVVLLEGAVVPGHVFRMPVGLLSSADKLAVIDVDLPGAPGDYVIVIVGAYDMPRSHAIEADDVRLALEPASGDTGTLARVPASREIIADAYGSQIAQQRGTGRYRERLVAAAQARRVNDPGYFHGVDSAYVPRSLTAKLESDRDQVTFAVASCRYSPMLLDRERADATFGRLRDLLDENVEAAPSMLLLVGDQVYVDATAGLADAKTRRERCYDVYREAWTAPNAREVLRRLPVYMMMDDHEAGDNWHPDDPADARDLDARLGENTATLRFWGVQAFLEYQLSHSPKAGALGAGMKRGMEPPYDYAFEAAGFHFYVLDTRSGRSVERMLSTTQFADLKRWLLAHRATDRPKFVVSPSVLVPFLKQTRGSTPLEEKAYALRSDAWDGYPDSMRELFALIADEKIANVVFLSGDSHLSMTSEVRVRRADGTTLEALSVVASPMYAPYPFSSLTRAEVEESGTIALPGEGAMSYSVHPESWCDADSFSVVSVTRDAGKTGWTIGITVHGLEGPARQTEFYLPGAA